MAENVVWRLGRAVFLDVRRARYESSADGSYAPCDEVRIGQNIPSKRRSRILSHGSRRSDRYNS